MNGWLASFALIGGFIAFLALLGALIWLVMYCLYRLGVGS
jgi:flagellar biogenesis protein FliO